MITLWRSKVCPTLEIKSFQSVNYFAERPKWFIQYKCGEYETDKSVGQHWKCAESQFHKCFFVKPQEIGYCKANIGWALSQLMDGKWSFYHVDKAKERFWMTFCLFTYLYIWNAFSIINFELLLQKLLYIFKQIFTLMHILISNNLSKSVW